MLQAPVYGGHYDEYDEYQNLAVAVDCKPFASKVYVEAYDQSRGEGNGVARAFVAVKACSFAAQAGPANY
jgi:hypothetical protein